MFDWGSRAFIKGLCANVLRPEAIDRLVEHVASGPAGGSFGVTAMGGAIARVDEDATAFAGRAARYDLSADVSWTDSADDDRSSAWVREAMAVVEPDAVVGRYANENSDAGADETRLFYGDAKLARLAGLKRTWDPDNVFRLNHNVEPAAT